jgi:hypothetical protein
MQKGGHVEECALDLAPVEQWAPIYKKYRIYHLKRLKYINLMYNTVYYINLD